MGNAQEGKALMGNAQDVVAALVIFNSRFARDDCLRHYSLSAADKACVDGVHLEHLQVLPGPHPQDVLWENFEVGRWERMVRRVGSACVLLLLLAVCLASVIVIKAYQHRIALETQWCGSPQVALACNAHIDWRSPPKAGSGGGYSDSYYSDTYCAGTSARCTLGDIWGVSSLLGAASVRTPSNVTEEKAEEAEAAGKAARSILASTPMVANLNAAAGVVLAGASASVLLPDACRYEHMSVGVWEVPGARETEADAAARAACLAKSRPSKAQAAALLHAAYTSTHFRITVPRSRDGVSGGVDTDTANRQHGDTPTSQPTPTNQRNVSSNGASYCSSCLCAAMIADADGAVVGEAGGDAEGVGVCSAHLQRRERMWALWAGAIVVVVSCNHLVRVCVGWLRGLERQRLVSEAEAWEAVSIGAALFFNTVLVFVIVFAETEAMRRTIAAAAARAVRFRKCGKLWPHFTSWITGRPRRHRRRM